MKRRSVSILGTRGVPANYGGFETFAHHLALYLVTRDWDVTVYCQNGGKDYEDMWHGVKRIHIASALKGALGTAMFDARALFHALKHENGIWLTLGYNTGGLNLVPRMLGKKQMINMDGVEWRRAKWNPFYKAVLYLNYWLAGLAGNRLIADHPEIERMMQDHFYVHKITMIPYGAETIVQGDETILQKMGLETRRYVTVIARPEPENSILEIVQAWSRKQRPYKLIVLGNFSEENPYHAQIKAAALKDILFPGAIFDPNIIQALRFHARAHVHGHTVGGTNPSLVEALGAGNAIIAQDNAFNRWVAQDAAHYFRNTDDLAHIFDTLLSRDEALGEMRMAARKRHAEAFQWTYILEQYETALLQLLGET